MAILWLVVTLKKEIHRHNTNIRIIYYVLLCIFVCIMSAGSSDCTPKIYSFVVIEAFFAFIMIKNIILSWAAHLILVSLHKWIKKFFCLALLGTSWAIPCLTTTGKAFWLLYTYIYKKQYLSILCILWTKLHSTYHNWHLMSSLTLLHTAIIGAFMTTAHRYNWSVTLL